MKALFKAHKVLLSLPADQREPIHQRGSLDLGKRAGSMGWAYPAFLLCMFFGSDEIRLLAKYLAPIGAVMLIASAARHFYGKRLACADQANIARYRSLYGWCSLICAACLGLFTGITISQTRLSTISMVMIIATAGMSGGATGTMSQYQRLWSGFQTLIWLPVIIACLKTGTDGADYGYLLALLCFLYFSFTTFLGFNLAGEYWLGLVNLSTLQQRTNELAEALQVIEEKENEVRLHRDHLKELVEKKTADLVLAKDAAERANQSKSEFLAKMSHELRTPIHAILSFPSFGIDKLETAGPEKLGNFFERIQESGNRLLMLLNDLLDLSKLEAGKVEINLKEHDLKQVVARCVAEQETRLSERNLILEIEPPQCQTRAEFDAFAISQVVTNLLSNAIKFTPQGKSIALSFSDDILAAGRRATDRRNLAAICFKVTDQGVSIPEAELLAVFDKFIQSSNTSAAEGGTGLGLAISKEIIDLHYGRIWAENNPEGGATFAFKIPIQPGESKARGEALPIHQAQQD